MNLIEREFNDLQNEAIEIFNDTSKKYNAEQRAFAYGWIQALNWMIENKLVGVKK